MEKIDSKEELHKLIKQYQNLIFSICLKLTGDYFAAEDLTQETFLSAYQHFDQFDGENEKAWLCRIATNKCYDYSKEAARRLIATPEEEMPPETAPLAEEPLQQILNQEIMEQLMNAIEALPPPYREIARAQYIDGKTAKEIAFHRGKKLKTIQTQGYRARELLKQKLRKEMLAE